MNCVNHPDAAVAAYCQNCGKALCAQCVRPVSGVIYCEQCLAAKLGIGGVPGPVPGSAPGYTVSGSAGGVNYNVNQGAYTVTGSAGDLNYAVSGVIPPSGPNPGTATILGFIPGVGAMYNGQFVKALVHVLVFVILIGITDNHGIFGIFIAAWVFYQVFDANQTAKARRDGLPLPDPFGLNELGAKLGIPNSPFTPSATQTYPPAQTYTPPQAYTAAPPQPGAGYPPAAGFAPGPGYPPAANYTNPAYPPYSAVPPVGAIPPDVDPYMPVPRREPVGAIILIGLGLLFLFNTLGFFRFDWVGHAWPLFIIGLGAWLLIRRARGVRPPPAPPVSPIPPAPPAGGTE